MRKRPIMKGQTHFPHLDVHGDRVIGVCGDMRAELVPTKPGTIVYLPEDCGQARIDADQIPNLIAALQCLNDYLQENHA